MQQRTKAGQQFGGLMPPAELPTSKLFELTVSMQPDKRQVAFTAGVDAKQ